MKQIEEIRFKTLFLYQACQDENLNIIYNQNLFNLRIFLPIFNPENWKKAHLSFVSFWGGLENVKNGRNEEILIKSFYFERGQAPSSRRYSKAFPASRLTRTSRECPAHCPIPFPKSLPALEPTRASVPTLQSPQTSSNVTFAAANLPGGQIYCFIIGRTRARSRTPATRVEKASPSPAR